MVHYIVMSGTVNMYAHLCMCMDRYKSYHHHNVGAVVYMATSIPTYVSRHVDMVHIFVMASTGNMYAHLCMYVCWWKSYQ